MTEEWRDWTCPDCGDRIERLYLVRTIAKGVRAPEGFRVEKRGTSWNTYVAPTRFTTLCLCDAP